MQAGDSAAGRQIGHQILYIEIKTIILQRIISANRIMKPRRRDIENVTVQIVTGINEVDQAREITGMCASANRDF